MDVAAASVVSSAALGFAGIAVPAFARRGEREHVRVVTVRERRADAYTGVLRMMGHIQRLDEDATNQESREAAILVWLWGSREVRDLFFRWLDVMPSMYGPQATDEDTRRVTEAANRVRQRMSDEVQGV